MTPQIKQRIEQIRRGEVPEGYTKTKEGIIPSDWAIKKMKQWISLEERPVTLQDDEDYELVTVRRAYGGVDSRGIYKGKDVLVKTYFSVEKDDFIISKRQIAHGACGLVPEKLHGAVVSNEYNVFKSNEGTNIHFFNLMMQLPHYKRLFYLMSDGVHIEKLLFKTGDWMKRSLAMPPLAEQKKIAEILSAQDKLIALKEKLIEEKKRKKKYLMQQLLTGKKRLPGFSGEWDRVKIGQILKIRHGQSQHEVEDENGKYPILGTGGIIGHTNSYLYNKPSVLIGRKGTIDRPQYMESPFWTIDTLFYSEIFENYVPRYIYYVFCNIDWNLYNEASGVPSLNSNTIENIRIELPDYHEQLAITKLIYSADNELDLLNRDLNQEKHKKKALMQLLLSGVVRVNNGCTI